MPLCRALTAWTVPSAAPVPPSPLAALADELCGHAALSSFSRRGFAAVENALDPALCRDLCADIDTLHALGCMVANEAHHVRLAPQGSSQTLRLRKPGIFEIEGASFKSLPVAAARALRCVAADASLLYALPAALGVDLSSQSLKAQLNVGEGGCFPPHVDSDAAVDGRRITLLLYPATGGSSRGSDGALRLFPFPYAPVDIPLSPGLAVAFSATAMLHGTLPAASRRHCVTLWLSGPRPGAGPGAASTPPGAAAAAHKLPPAAADLLLPLLRVLMHPEVRPFAARWLYADAIAASFPLAFDATAAAAALESHDREQPVLAAALARLLEKSGVVGEGSGPAALARLRGSLPLTESLPEGGA
jgi:hypothetical protein